MKKGLEMYNRYINLFDLNLIEKIQLLDSIEEKGVDLNNDFLKLIKVDNITDKEVLNNLIQ